MKFEDDPVYQTYMNSEKLLKERSAEYKQYIKNIGKNSYIHDNRTFVEIQNAVIASDIATIESVKLQWHLGIISIARRFLYRTYLPLAELVNIGNEELILYMMGAPDERKFISFWAWNVEGEIRNWVWQHRI